MDMERSCFVENGGIRIPIGYRFLPTNEELLVHYLRPKVLAIPFPASVIPECDVFQTDPWGLPGDLNKDRYFFSNHSKTGKCKRAAGSGHWKFTGKCKLIVVPHSNHHQTVGIRRTLVFTQNKSPRAAETRWFMHQFCFVGPPTTQVLDWAVYRLFQKKRKQKKQPSVISKVKSIEEQSLRSSLIPQLSSCSSGVTDEEDSVYESALLDQEASSDVFPSFSCMRKQDY